MKKSLFFLTALGGLLSHGYRATAQGLPATPVPRADFPYSNRFTLGGGISQLLLGGFNVQAEYTTKRMVFDYSHGFNLKLTGASGSRSAQDQKLSENMRSTLGVGIGYRLTPSLDVRFEPKLHYFELYNDDTQTSGNLLVKYRTVTLGLGAYYRYYPFRHQTNALAGLLVMPSVRYWPNVWSSLDNDQLSYRNRAAGRPETYKAATQGLAGTGGLLANITIGYTFGFRKK